MRKTYRYELKIRWIAKKELQRQFSYLKNHWEELYENLFLRYFSRYGKNYEKQLPSLDEFWQAMGVYRLTEKIRQYVQKVLLLWYKINYRQNSEILSNFGIQFTLENPLVREYMNRYDHIQLSDKFWSIPFTTKNAVIAELRRWINESLTYTQIAENINALEPTIFSLNRAKMIAVRETGMAYEWWNYIPMKEAQNQWAIVRKKWLTVHDDRVTPECTALEEEGWIPLIQAFSNWDDLPPRSIPLNPRCRCTTQYRIS